MEFSLDVNGILRHHCSGKMVCPENGATNNGARLTVSSTCTEENSKFERTAGKPFSLIYKLLSIQRFIEQII